MTRGIVTNLWLIPAVPLAASLIILSLANSRRSAGAVLAIIGQVAALALSILAFSLTLQTPGFRAIHNFTWFFAYLSFFSGAMFGVVIANSLLLLFVCWELVGLASYLLIGFWIEKPSAAAAAKKAFITTRIG